MDTPGIHARLQEWAETNMLGRLDAEPTTIEQVRSVLIAWGYADARVWQDPNDPTKLLYSVGVRYGL